MLDFIIFCICITDALLRVITLSTLKNMKDSNKHLISAKEIALKYDISYPTINHYTNLGFLSVVKRKGNRRLYEEKEVLATLQKISQLKDEGYPLRLIHKMLKKHK